MKNKEKFEKWKDFIDMRSKKYNEVWTEEVNCDILKDVDDAFGNVNKDVLKLLNMFVAHVKGTNSMIVGVSGGNNGQSNWIEYLIDISLLISSLDNKDYHVDLMEIQNDVADDVYICLLSFSKKV